MDEVIFGDLASEELEHTSSADITIIQLDIWFTG
jgi:hypothetical protein